MDLRDHIRAVPDFPIPGILFRDITPLLLDGAAFRHACDLMTRHWGASRIDAVASIESRGFIFGAVVARNLDAGFIPVRKTGKLPWKTRSVQYELEYRADTLYMHEDAVQPGQRVLVVDDLIATGGTAKAVVELIEGLGGTVAGIGFLIELADLKGRDLLAGYDVRSEITFEGG